MTKKPAIGETLTRREIECLTLRAEGLTPGQAAERLFITKRTVDFHCDQAYQKLGVHSILQAINALRELQETKPHV